jgi:hypothetical protein
MITVYVIESLIDETWYPGMAKVLNHRLHEHSSGKNRFTKDINFDLNLNQISLTPYGHNNNSIANAKLLHINIA